MLDVYEGQFSVVNDDGSTTHYTIENEPPYEPMSRTSAILWTAGTLVMSALLIGSPIIVDKWVERSDNNKTKRDRQKLNKEIFDQIPA